MRAADYKLCPCQDRAVVAVMSVMQTDFTHSIYTASKYVVLTPTFYFLLVLEGHKHKIL